MKRTDILLVLKMFPVEEGRTSNISVNWERTSCTLKERVGLLSLGLGMRQTDDIWVESWKKV